MLTNEITKKGRAFYDVNAQCGQRLTIDVVIPAHDSSSTLLRCIESLQDTRFPFSRVIVVDDGSITPVTYCTEAIPFTLVRLPISIGPAAARNVGARHGSADLILFLDSDVMVSPSLPFLIQGEFSRNKVLDACVGTYDREPSCVKQVSLFRNLLHAYTHEASEGTIDSFWGACGTVRREVFASVNGFDPTFVKPSIEDVELGYRMVRHGASIRLINTLKIKHLKVWTLSGMIKTDMLFRARPWARLIHSGRVPRTCLARRASQQCCGALVLVSCISIPALFLSNRAWLATSSIAFESAILMLINYNFLCFYRRHPRSNILVGFVLMHVYYLSCSLGTILGTLDWFCCRAYAVGETCL